MGGVWTEPCPGLQELCSLLWVVWRSPALPPWPGLQSRGQPSTAARPQRPDILAALGLASRIRAAGEAAPGCQSTKSSFPPGRHILSPGQSWVSEALV